MIEDTMSAFTDMTDIHVDYDIYGNIVHIHPSTDGMWANNKERLIRYLNDNHIRYTIG